MTTRNKDVGFRLKASCLIPLFILASLMIGITGFLKGFVPIGPFSLSGRIGVMIGMMGCGLTAIVQLGISYLATKKPLHNILKTGRKSMMNDCNALAVAMTELVQGNLSKHITMQSKPLSLSSIEELNQIIEIFNEIILSLKKTASEFNNVTGSQCLRLCYVGSDSYLEGYRCGEVMAESIQRRGEVAILTGYFSVAGHELRRKGFMNYINENYPDIKIVDIAETRQDFDICYKYVQDLLKRFPGLDGIYMCGGVTSRSAAKVLVENKKHGKIKIVTHDMTDDNMQCIIDGSITAVLEQGPFAQGHDPVIHLYNHLVANWQPPVPRMLTPMDVITFENYQQFWHQGKGHIQSEDARENLAKPVGQNPIKPLRIAFVGREEASFWIPVHDGVNAAAEKLKVKNVQVDWIVPEANKSKKQVGADAYGPVFETLMEENVDGVAAVVSEQALVPYVNKLVQKGIPVIAYNTEPVSLRNLVFTIIEQAKRLTSLSQNISGNTYQVRVATEQINNAMNDMANGTLQQNEHVKNTQKTLDSLLGNIDRVNRESMESAKASDQTAQAVASGTEAMAKTLGSLATIEHSASATWQMVGELGEQSNKIDTIVDLINDIASRVNVLALNANIEAVHAGEYGKGFMVVANEIRSLAKSTSKATSDITVLISTIQKNIGSVSKVISAGMDKIKQSANLTDEASGTLNKIRKLVEIDKKRMHNIASSIKQMQQFSHEVGESMQKVASVSDQNSEVVESVNMATKDMSLRIEQVAESTDLLKGMADTELQLLAKFNLSDDEG